MNQTYTEEEGIQPLAGSVHDNGPVDLSLFSAPDCLIDIHENGRHWVLEWVELLDQTDKHDRLIRYDSKELRGYATIALQGHFFHLTNRRTGQTILLVKEAPSRASQTMGYPFDFLLILNDGRLDAGIFGRGYKEGSAGRAYTAKLIRGNQKLWSEWLYSYDSDLRNSWTGWNYEQAGTIMSNTWGDRNRDERISENFILSEIHLAADLKLDVVQIDDGWQTGRTMNSGLVPGNGIWEGYYSVDSNFWEPDAAKFPHGLLGLVRTAAESGIRLSLWFSPDSYHDFGNWRRDVETLANIQRKYGISLFKLDGVKLRNKNAEANYLSLLTALEDENIEYILDVTAEQRLGYLCEPRRGLLFVENRYTDWRTYYPWKTLRNLWDLSHYVPSFRMQFEVLNPCRNTDKYDSPRDAELSPQAVPIDWSFWSVVPSNPLIWMELSGLPLAEKNLLSTAIQICNRIKSDLSRCRVIPIGKRPNGSTASGFIWIDAVSGDLEYILVLTQSRVRSSITFNLIDDNYPHRPSEAYLNTLLNADMSGNPSTKTKLKVMASSASTSGSNSHIRNSKLIVNLSDRPWQYVMLKVDR